MASAAESSTAVTIVKELLNNECVDVVVRLEGKEVGRVKRCDSGDVPLAVQLPSGGECKGLEVRGVGGEAMGPDCWGT
jgi:hypothetical protein